MSWGRDSSNVWCGMIGMAMSVAASSIMLPSHYSRSGCTMSLVASLFFEVLAL